MEKTPLILATTICMPCPGAAHALCSDLTSEGLGEMFKSDFAGTSANRFLLMLKGGRVRQSRVCTRGPITPTSMSGNCFVFLVTRHFNH